MAVPKRKTSKSRKNTRRAAIKASSPAIVSCPQCHEPKRAHTVCEECGYYRDKEVVKILNNILHQVKTRGRIPACLFFYER
jgi:large subunit ribosomal protein L32